MGTRLFIKEGGDARLPNQPRGFYLQLRAPEIRPVELYLVFARKEEQGYRVFEKRADSLPTPISEKHFEMKEALEFSFNQLRKRATEDQASYQIPVMYQDTNPGEGKVIRNLESFMPEFTV